MSATVATLAPSPRRRRRGQATTEYFLLVSVAVVGLAVAAYAFIPGFQEGVIGLTTDTRTLFGAGTSNGSSDAR
ncbi:MAG: hypothetical protein Q8P41_14875 [Pseudomonadota bacterium]|nr:hypothetical protein [Pseudomonadota bacterium]